MVVILLLANSIERLGDTARKLHTGRSRNDQVSTDLKLYVRDAVDAVDALLRDVQAAFVTRAELDAGVIMAGYTHLQRAQPVQLAHYWLAYCEKFERDRQRLADCRRRANVSPLGCAALAGLGAGVFADVDEAVARLVAIRRGAKPDPRLVERYDRLAALFDDLYNEAMHHYDRLNAV